MRSTHMSETERQNKEKKKKKFGIQKFSDHCGPGKSVVEVIVAVYS